MLIQQPALTGASRPRVHRSRSTALFVLAAAAAGCSSVTNGSAALQVSAVDMALTARENTTRALRGVSSTADFLTESSTLAEMMSSLFRTSCAVEPTSSDAADSSATASDTTEPATTSDCTTSAAVSVEDLQKTHQRINDSIDSLEAMLRDEIFIEANLVSEDANQVVYRVPASAVCGPVAADDTSADPSAPAPGVADAGGASELDPACVERIDHYAPKLRLSSPGGQNVNVALLLGPSARDVATFELGTERLGFTIDLTQTFAVSQELDETLSSISELSGKVQLELVRRAEKDYSIRYNILEDVGLTTTTDGESISITESAQSPAFELRLDARSGPHGTVTGTYDLGAVRVTAPLNTFRDLFSKQEYDAAGDPIPRTVYTGALELFLAGFEGSLAYSGDLDRLDFRGLGLGDVSSFLKHEGNTLFQLDLNEEFGRHFDLTFGTGGGHTSLTLSPSFDLKLAVKLQALADQLQDLPSQWLDNVYHVWFDASDPVIELEDNQVRVVTGTLHLDTSQEPSNNLTVSSGMCLLQRESDLVDGDDDQPPTSDTASDGGAPDPTPAEPPPDEPAPAGPYGNVTAGACL